MNTPSDTNDNNAASTLSMQALQTERNIKQINSSCDFTGEHASSGISITNEKLLGKVALISGGTNGIGLKCAQVFLEAGASVITLGVTPTHIQKAKQKFAEMGACVIDELDLQKIPKEAISKGGFALVLNCDVSSTKAIKETFARVKKSFDKLDVLLLSAAIASPRPVEEVTEEIFDAQVNINVKGIFFSIQSAIPLLNPNSSIISITSIASKRCTPPFAIYAATKAAVSSLTRSIAFALGPKLIRVNSICPGFIENAGLENTGLSPEALNEIKATLINRTTLKCAGSPIEVAKIALFLACSDSSFITGSEIVVDGGANITVF